MSKTDDRAKQQAQAQLESIKAMVKRMRRGFDGDLDDADDARDDILESPLSVEMRSGWHTLGEQLEAAEYRILLCTGGPAVCLTGNLDCDSYPADASIKYQDWFKPWTEYPTTDEDDESLLTYARVCIR